MYFIFISIALDSIQASSITDDNGQVEGVEAYIIIEKQLVEQMNVCKLDYFMVYCIDTAPTSCSILSSVKIYVDRHGKN